MPSKSCNLVLLNNFCILPTRKGRVEKKPMSILSDFFVNSKAFYEMPFDVWLTDIILTSFDSRSYMIQTEYKYELQNTIQNIEKQSVLVNRLFPLGFDFTEENWGILSRTLQNIIYRKRGVNPKHITLDSFEQHEVLFSENLNKLMRI